MDHTPFQGSPMPRKSSEGVTELWYQALASPYGIEVQTNDTRRLMTRLYNARKATQDQDLEQISLCESPFDPLKLWLVKRIG